jgi:integrase
VYRARDGRWRYAVVIGWHPDGRPIRRYGTARTEAEAKARLRIMLTERDAGALRPQQAPTVAGWLDTWLTTIAPQRVKPLTLVRYRSMTDTWLTPHLGRIRLDKLQPEDVERLHRVMTDAGRSPATCLQAHRILARALRVAEQRGHIRRNVASLVDAPSLRRTEQDYLRTHEIEAIIGAARGDPLEARWAVAFLGLRRGEALALTWPDIDLDAGYLTVHRTLGRLPKVGLIVTPPKTKASRDAVALPAPVVRMLRQHRRRQLEIRVEEGPAWSAWTSVNGVGPLELVFCQRSGRPVDPRVDWQAWKALCVRAGVRVTTGPDGNQTSTARPHLARHATATMLRTQGEPTRVIQAMLRHASPTITAALYEHVVPEVQSDAAARLGDRLFGQ